MEIAKIDVSRADARKVYCQTLTAGMAGVEVTFSFDDAWDGLHRIATFKAGGTAKDVLLTDDRCEIPPEVLAKPCARLVVGVYGERADGTLVIPTLWAELGRVEQGVTPSGDISGKHTPEVWAQIQGQIGNLEELDSENKETLVAAINEALRGGADREEIKRIVDEYLKEYGTGGTVKTVNGIAPDENGNVQIPVSGGNVDLTGYATEQWVKEQNYLTEVPEDYAKSVGDALNGKLSKSGGTMTGKIVFPTADQNVGFANSEDMKIFGYGTFNGAMHMRMGDTAYPFQIRGNGDRPKYNNGVIALMGDIPTDDHINGLINTALGVIENGTY